jgi:hypothetical protein
MYEIPPELFSSGSPSAGCLQFKSVTTEIDCSSCVPPKVQEADKELTSKSMSCKIQKANGVDCLW